MTQVVVQRRTKINQNKLLKSRHFHWKKPFYNLIYKERPSFKVYRFEEISRKLRFFGTFRIWKALWDSLSTFLFLWPSLTILPRQKLKLIIAGCALLEKSHSKMLQFGGKIVVPEKRSDNQSIPWYISSNYTQNVLRVSFTYKIYLSS